MARLTRVHQKVFASNASNNGVFGSLQAGNPQTSNDVATLQSLSAFENGWDDAIEQGDKLPPLEEFQGIQYGISYQQAYMLQEGIAEWDANTDYYKGSLVKTISGTSFKLYCSLADNNKNHTVTNTTYWQKVMDSDDAYAYNSAVVHNTGNETIAGTKTFSSTISGSISGNAGTVTNGVYTTGTQTISGNKTFSGTNTFSGSNTVSGSIALGSSATATTPSATDSSTKVATTAWVAGHRTTTRPSTTSTASVNAPDIVVSNYYNSSNGYWAIKFSSGFIIQGGKSYSTLSDNEGRTITFPKAFSTTDYSISAIPVRGSSVSGYRCVIVNTPATYKKTTTVSIFNDGEDIAGFEWIAMGY